MQFEQVRRALFGAGMVTLVASAAAYATVQQQLHDAVDAELQLQHQVGRILTLDEILTMSARMAAGVHDPRYQARYDAAVGELEALLEATIARSTDPEVLAAARSTEAANDRLVDLETRSFALDAERRYAEALALLEGPEYQQDKTSYAAGMGRAFARLQKLTGERRSSAARTSHLLLGVAIVALGMVVTAWSRQRQQQRQALQQAALLEDTVALRTSELGARNRSMRLVLDTVQQGLLVVDRDGRMASERSAMVARWFGEAGPAVKLTDYVRAHDPTFATWFELGLEQLMADTLPLELCLGQLPARLRVGTTTLAVEYQPMRVDGALEALLVVLSDLTTALEREQVEGEQRDLLRLLEFIERDRAGVVGFLREAHALVADLEGTRSLVDSARLVHTLKGNTAQYGMTVMARACQEVEERVALEGGLTASDRAFLVATWRRMAEQIVRIVGVRSQSHLDVRRAEYDKVVGLVADHHAYDDILDELKAWQLDPIQARLDRLGDGARVLAERLGKPGLEVVCTANGLRSDLSPWASFWSSCVHLVRNAVDHGIETREQRVAAGKPPNGRLTLDASLRGAEFVVRIADDGAGIDWKALRQRAAALQVSGPEEDLLFADGLSSRDIATDVSGRGLGMAVVRQEVTRRNGRIAVVSEPGHGTVVELCFPNHMLVPGYRPSPAAGSPELSMSDPG